MSPMRKQNNPYFLMWKCMEVFFRLNLEKFYTVPKIYLGAIKENFPFLKQSCTRAIPCFERKTA